MVSLDPNRKNATAGDLEFKLKNLIFGQEPAIKEIVDTYQTHIAGMSSPDRPIGNFLFLGPTGSGKTRIVEATAQSLLGDARAVLKIDCAEFQHGHEIAKLIGSPPGYLGHRETHPLLSQEVLNRFHTDSVKISFLLFDEIEKASDALWNLLLGILDKATLTLGDNRRVDFSRTLIFMTGNLGTKELDGILRPKLGFTAGMTSAVSDQKIEDVITEAARRKFSPEFINRIDKIVVFQALGESELRQILELELDMVRIRVSQAFSSTSQEPFKLRLTERAKDFLLREGTHIEYGARHLKRAIERNLVHQLSNLIATGQVRDGEVVRVDCNGLDNKLLFFGEPRKRAASNAG